MVTVTASDSLGNGAAPAAIAVTVKPLAPTDFNGDGYSDLLWQNSSGQPAIWLMNGTSPIAKASVGGNPGPKWHFKATGDFNADGDADILLQKSSGGADIWEMQGTIVIGGGSLGNPGPDWHAVATGDFNGDGHADILWQNDDGEVDIWKMNGTTIVASGSVGNPGRGGMSRATASYGPLPVPICYGRATSLRPFCFRTTMALQRSGRPTAVP